MSTRLTQIASYLPERFVTNEELAGLHPDWDLGAIASRTGVHGRHWAAPGETAVDLAYGAAKKIIDKVEAVDALVLCTQSPDHKIPHGSAALQARLGLPSTVAAFDISLACSGFVYGAAISKAFLDGLGMKRVLLVTSDTYSRYLHPADRTTVPLFGDGAAACLFESGGEGSELIDLSLGTDGSLLKSFYIPAGGLREPLTPESGAAELMINGGSRSRETVHMDGPSVLAFAEKRLPAAISDILHRNGLAQSDVRLVVFHQASLTALSLLRRKLSLRDEQLFCHLERVGNTVSSSIPIALEQAAREGRLNKGDLVLLVGFGAGFSWGTGLLRW
jgi:3-oxoacyl-[acyl-carrier-protein] synthase III